MRIGNTKKLITNENEYINSMFGLINPDFHKPNRTGIDTYANYNYVFNFDIANNKKDLPVLLGKHTMLKGALTEIIWIMMGRTDNKFLVDNGVKYWTPWQKEDGNFGPIYGYQMRNFNGVDQLKDLMNGLRDNFESRRHMISLWNPNDLSKMALPPCHFHYHFTTYTRNNEKYINLHATQRSGDSFLGVPYDLLMFMYMLEIVAFVANINTSELFLTINDYHLYENHKDSLNKYDTNFWDNVHTQQNRNDLYPTSIKFKPFVYEMKKKNPNITIDEFLHYIVLNNFDVFDFKNRHGEIFTLPKNTPRITATVAV